MWIRFVCVPNLTLKDEKIHKLGALAKKYHCIEKVDLIPFHQLGAYKYKALNLEYRLESTPTPSESEMQKARAILKEYGF